MPKYSPEPEHGAISEPYVAMTYLLYVLEAMGGHATRAELDAVTAAAGRLNYFLAASSLASLQRTMHVDLCQLPGKENFYAITSLGRECLEALGGDLNPEIRKRIDAAAKEYKV
ncbi:MAG TPA: DUF4364 family protein [Terriglobales bacterium]|nr:DUF4364 family protein [Terriglobales bacterium]